MNIPAYLRNIGAMALAVAVTLLSLTSCDSAIYDDEGDCSVYYRLKFRYDLNLKWADAFAHEVSSVHLYAFDKAGLLIWQKAEKIDPLTADDYEMTLDIPAGEYHLIAWCGLENDGERDESFTVPAMTPGTSRQHELTSYLNRMRDAGGAYSKERLYPLFHGMLDVNLPSNDDGGEYTYTMPLTKDTNHIRIILLHLSGEDVDDRMFTFRIDDANGFLDHNNDLLADENIEYRPTKTQSSIAGIGTIGDDSPSRAIIQSKGAIADFTVGRLFDSRRNDMILTIINNNTGETVAKVPVIDCALLAKNYYEEEYRCTMSDQDFLDREDDYVMTFFLDRSDRWTDGCIFIHSWRVVHKDIDIETE